MFIYIVVNNNTAPIYGLSVRAVEQRRELRYAR